MVCNEEEECGRDHIGCIICMTGHFDSEFGPRYVPWSYHAIQRRQPISKLLGKSVYKEYMIYRCWSLKEILPGGIYRGDYN
jgi:hypothetical protein